MSIEPRLTVTAAASYLGMTPSAFAMLHWTGDAPAWFIEHGQRMYEARHLDAWMEEQHNERLETAA